MREVKFRAWDKEAKQMIYSEGGECDYCFLFDGEGKIYCCYLLTDIDYEGTEYTKEIRLDNIMQYTGLKDKNRTEIYEGDIVRFGKEIGIIGELQHGSFTFNRKETYWKCEPIPFCAMSFKHVEVIGNIYENPELLEGRE